MNSPESPLFSVRIARRGFHKRPLVVSVGKKVAKHAVVRNRIKRRIAAAFRKCARSAPERDILLGAKQAIGKATYADIEHEIRRTLESL